MKKEQFVPLMAHHAVNGARLSQNRILGLRKKQIAPGHLYQGPWLSWLWHRVHLAHSPLRRQARSGHKAPDLMECARAFIPALKKLNARSWSFISMGCGDGHKDLLFLNELRRSVPSVFYRPTDISAELVSQAMRSAEGFRTIQTQPGVICDLSAPTIFRDMARLSQQTDAAKGFLFFGINPNFSQAEFFHLLKKALKTSDVLVFSANLTPGNDALAGMKKILPQYDNRETREWLLGFLQQIGIPFDPSGLRMSIEEFHSPTRHFAFVATYHFPHHTVVDLNGEKIRFQKNERLELFRSYRHTPDSLRVFCRKAGISIADICVTLDGQEAAILCTKKAS